MPAERVTVDGQEFVLIPGTGLAEFVYIGRQCLGFVWERDREAEIDAGWTGADSYLPWAGRLRGRRPASDINRGSRDSILRWLLANAGEGESAHG